MVLKFDFGQMPIIRFSVTTEGQDVRQIRDEIEDALIKPLSRVSGVGSVQLRNAPEKKFVSMLTRCIVASWFDHE